MRAIRADANAYANGNSDPNSYADHDTHAYSNGYAKNNSDTEVYSVTKASAYSGAPADSVAGRES